MKCALFLLALALSGCSNAASEAEKRYKIVQAEGDLAATCDQAKDLKQAYLSAGDTAGYREAKKREEYDCAAARLDALR